jgi:hypothetical protein
LGSNSAGWHFQDMRNSAAASNRSGDIHKPGTPRERRHESGTGEYGSRPVLAQVTADGGESDKNIIDRRSPHYSLRVTISRKCKPY